MTDIKSFLLVVLIVIIVFTVINNVKVNKQVPSESSEPFATNTQNLPYTNKNDVADYMAYGENKNPHVFDKMPAMYGPSDSFGVNLNSKSDVFDERGYKWSKYGKDPRINIVTNEMNNDMLKQKFNRMYSLDPSGDVAQYDISNLPISPQCCPATYAPPFDVGGGQNCDFANKYVANNYTGMNYDDGIGCVCMTPKQAEFYGSRGGNA